MADIFISYSKADRDLVVRLAAMLEAEGWSVWWDKGLKPADTYRDEIMKQLATARAVICVWTPTSITSDWVRAEAGRAKADGKLIPVQTAGVDYKDIPLPFGEMHTEIIDRNDLIQAAVVAQLAKPTHQQPVAIRVGKQLKYQLLSWLGIAGGALSLFAQLDQIIRLSDWSRLIVNNWRAWNHYLWTEALEVSGIRSLLEKWNIAIDPFLSNSLSFSVFIIFIALGVRLRSQPSDERETLATFTGKFARSFTVVPKWAWFGVAALTVVFSSVHFFLVEYFPFEAISGAILILAFFSVAALISLLLIASPDYRNLMRENFFHPTSHTSWLVLIISLVFLAPKSHDMQFSIAIALGSVIGIIACFLAPPRPLTKRLLYVIIGLGVIIVLNELSKLNLNELLARELSGR